MFTFIVHVQYIYCICTVHVQYMYCTCTLHVLYMYCICTVHVHYMYTTLYMYTICTVYVLYMYTTCTVYVVNNISYHYRSCLHLASEIVNTMFNKRTSCLLLGMYIYMYSTYIWSAKQDKNNDDLQSVLKSCFKSPIAIAIGFAITSPIAIALLMKLLSQVYHVLSMTTNSKLYEKLQILCTNVMIMVLNCI